ncbi:MAG: acyl-CoA desaturase [Planctomycetota bacterium]
MRPKYNWPSIIVLTLSPIAAAVLIPWAAVKQGFTAFEWSMFVLFMFMTGLSISAGYHRLWSHKSYKSALLPRIFYAVWGACSLQNSVLHWASDHRRHHRHTDDNHLDPYSAKRGFWFSHMGWILREHESGKDDFSNVKDLEQDPVVRWQHRYYIPIAVATNVGIPLALGFWHGRWWGCLLLCGLLRMVLNHHFTFCINSLAHIWGSQPYSTANTSRDSNLIALLTYGEGYHNYHHCFQHDYRNGVKWWHYDPAKWVIAVCSWVGLASDLKRTPRETISAALERRQAAAA